jgi:hypothetical protein
MAILHVPDKTRLWLARHMQHNFTVKKNIVCAGRAYRNPSVIQPMSVGCSRTAENYHHCDPDVE